MWDDKRGKDWSKQEDQKLVKSLGGGLVAIFSYSDANTVIGTAITEPRLCFHRHYKCQIQHQTGTTQGLVEKNDEKEEDDFEIKKLTKK